jgi:hypothetical protein
MEDGLLKGTTSGWSVCYVFGVDLVLLCFFLAVVIKLCNLIRVTLFRPTPRHSTIFITTFIYLDIYLKFPTLLLLALLSSSCPPRLRPG